MAVPPVFVSGQVLTAAQMNAVGLWEIQSASFTTSSAETYTCFTSDYDFYRIVVSISAASATDTSLGMQYGNSGTFSTTTYGNFNFYALSDGTSGAFSQSNFAASSNYLAQIGGDKMPVTISADIYNPFLATPTRYTAQSFISYLAGAGQRRGVLGMAGGHDASTSYAQLRILPGSGTITGSIKIYGYRN